MKIAHKPNLDVSAPVAMTPEERALLISDERATLEVKLGDLLQKLSLHRLAHWLRLNRVRILYVDSDGCVSVQCIKCREIYVPGNKP
jgi:hypothetical protein